MIAENLVNGWYDKLSVYRKRGRHKKYSDLAILQCLQIRCLFGLKLRQTQGFINYIFEASGLSITCPDYTTLCKRGQKLSLDSRLVEIDKEFSYVSMDSTGIATYTGNEWLENKHGKRYSRRVWKKLHIAVDKEGNIIANSTTTHIEDDRPQVETLLKDIKAEEFLGDTGYDGEEVYKQLRKKGIKPIIRPPNSSIAIKLEHLKSERDKAVEYRKNKRYHAWRVKNKYGRRERVENTFFRFKTSFGNKFLSREDNNMKNEMTIKCQLLNKMFEIGKPISVRVS